MTDAVKPLSDPYALFSDLVPPPAAAKDNSVTYEVHFTVTGSDGSSYEVTGPDDATAKAAMAYVMKNKDTLPRVPVAPDPVSETYAPPGPPATLGLIVNEHAPEIFLGVLALLLCMGVVLVLRHGRRARSIGWIILALLGLLALVAFIGSGTAGLLVAAIIENAGALSKLAMAFLFLVVAAAVIRWQWPGLMRMPNWPAPDPSPPEPIDVSDGTGHPDTPPKPHGPGPASKAGNRARKPSGPRGRDFWNWLAQVTRHRKASPARLTNQPGKLAPLPSSSDPS
jgi:hypothetical protein